MSIAAACVGIPRVSKAAWRSTGPIARWLVVSRAPVLVMTFCSAALGGLVAASEGGVDVVAWIGCVAGLLLAHAANNQLNDLTDSRLGIDAGNYFRTQYGVHVIEHGLATPAELLRTFALTAGAALAIGVWLTWRTGAGVLLPLGLGAFFLLAYTHPLKRWGLGELAVWLVWGPLMTAGTAFVAGRPSTVASATLVGAVYALAPTAVIFGKHIDKAAFDAAKGVRTLPVRLGVVRARRWVTGMVLGFYACVAALVFAQALAWTSALVLLSLWDARRLVAVCAVPAPIVRPQAFPASVWPLWYSAHAFAWARSTGLALLAALAFDAWWAA